jgi:hypothetical protein
VKAFQLQFDRLEPRRKKVAMVGFASSSRLKAPYADQSWEIWGENQLYRFVPRATRWFEMHPHEGPGSYITDMVKGTDYPAWLKACPIPLYMLSAKPEFPQSIEYPRQQLIDAFQLESIRPDLKEKGYFHSSVDYMIALAIYEGFEEIGVWGIDMTHDSEYAYQKPSGSFWLGFAKGRGIKVTIPKESALLKNEGYAYGYDPMPQNPVLMGLQGREKMLLGHREKLVTELTAVDGSIQENRFWQEQVRQIDRGATPSLEQ